MTNGWVKLPRKWGNAEIFQKNGLTVLLERELGGWHLSISHPKRYPGWEEIKDARYSLLPDDAQMAMFLPPKSEFVNLHPNCFHLFEVDNEHPLPLLRVPG